MTGLFEDLLESGADLRVSVTGKSMTPFLSSGDTVTIRRVENGRLTAGDLVFYRNRLGLPVLHRLIRVVRTGKGKRLLHTKGDALTVFDEPFTEPSLLGKVSFVEKAGRGHNQRTGLDMESLRWRIINRVIAGVSGLGVGARLTKSFAWFERLN